MNPLANRFNQIRQQVGNQRRPKPMNQRRPLPVKGPGIPNRVPPSQRPIKGDLIPDRRPPRGFYR